MIDRPSITKWLQQQCINGSDEWTLRAVWSDGKTRMYSGRVALPTNPGVSPLYFIEQQPDRWEIVQDD